FKDVYKTHTCKITGNSTTCIHFCIVATDTITVAGDAATVADGSVAISTATTTTTTITTEEAAAIITVATTVGATVAQYQYFLTHFHVSNKLSIRGI
ncbi:hypothetical protein WUBG_14706, partial [Wuchereria bancrofti]